MTNAGNDDDVRHVRHLTGPKHKVNGPVSCRIRIFKPLLVPLSPPSGVTVLNVKEVLGAFVPAVGTAQVAAGAVGRRCCRRRCRCRCPVCIVAAVVLRTWHATSSSVSLFIFSASADEFLRAAKPPDREPFGGAKGRLTWACRNISWW